MKGFGLGLIISLIIKYLIKLINAAIYALASLLMYFGLIVPFFYMIFAISLMLWCGLDLRISGVDTNLFYFGLTLSLLCSIVISIKNIIIYPIKDYLNYKRAKEEYKRRKEIAKKRELFKQNPSKYYAKFPEEMPPPADPIYINKKSDRDKPRPLIYRSKVNSKIIIHEFPDKFEVYKDTKEGIVYIETKKKQKSKKK